MNAGSFFFIALAVGFIGFEIFAAGRNSYRMEPEYVFAVYAKSAHAVAQCGPLESGLSEKFDASYRYVRGRAVAAVAGKSGPADRKAEAAVLEQELAVQQSVDALIRENNCESTEVWKLRKHYDNLARLNTPGSRAADLERRTAPK